MVPLSQISILAALAFVALAKLNETEVCNVDLGCQRLDRQYYEGWNCEAPHSKSIYHKCITFRNVLTDYKRQVILDFHNFIRRLPGNHGVSDDSLEDFPVAANMGKLSYDYALEDMAYEWAIKCHPSGYKCRDVMHGTVVGRNVRDLEGTGPIGDSDPIFDVEEWLNSTWTGPTVENYTFTEESSPLSQMLYDKATKIGCAEVTYEVPEDKFKYKRRLVCYYLPGIGPGTWTLYEERNPKEEKRADRFPRAAQSADSAGDAGKPDAGQPEAGKPQEGESAAKPSEAGNSTVVNGPAQGNGTDNAMTTATTTTTTATVSSTNERSTFTTPRRDTIEVILNYKPVLGKDTTPFLEYEPDVAFFGVRGWGNVNKGKFNLLLPTSLIVITKYMP